jgi:micrococcal nuclease
MKEQRKKLTSANLISLIFFILASALYLINEKYEVFGQRGADEFVAVTKVHDGDTVSVIVDRKPEKIRLIGIDAPEMGQKPWGEEAKRHLEALLNSCQWKVRLEYDVEKRDKYGRILAYLWTSDGRMINLLMVKSGYAMLFTFPPNVKHADELRTAQREARDGRAGIWAEKGLKERPGDYRKAHPRL